MSIFNCVGKLLTSKAITKAQADSITKRANQIKEKLRMDGEVDGLDQKATDIAMSEMKRDILEKKVVTAKKVERHEVLREAMSKDKAGHVAGLQSMLADITGRERAFDFVPLATHAEQLGNWAKRNIYKMAEDFRSKFGGRIDKFFFDDTEHTAMYIKARYGDEDVPAKYKEYARGVAKAEDELRARIKRAGVPVRESENFVFSRYISPYKLGKMTKQEFVDFVFELVDRKKSIDYDTGSVLTDKKLKEILAQQYDTIKTGGAVKALDKDNLFRGGSNLGKRYNKAQNYVLKDSDAYVKWWQRFGEGDILQAVDQRIDDLAEDVALFEIFGPDPDAVFFSLLEQAKALDGQTPPVRTKADKTFFGGVNAIGQVGPEEMYRTFRRKYLTQGSPRWAAFFSILRAITTGAKLGKASVSSIADMGHQQTFAKLYGIKFNDIMSHYTKEMNVFSKSMRMSQREAGAIMGAGLEGMVSSHTAVRRVAGDMYISGTMSKYAALFADFTLRNSGLQHWTAAGKRAFIDAAHQAYAVYAKKAWKDLDPDIRRILEINKIDEANLKEIGAAAFTKDNGYQAIDLSKLSDRTRDKFLGMLVDGQKLAVPEPGLTVRAVSQRGNAPGTFAREAMEQATLYKKFTMSVAHNQMATLLYHGMNKPLNKFQLAARMAYALTMWGTVAYTARKFTEGKKVKTENFEDVLNLFKDGFLYSGGAGAYEFLNQIGVLRDNEFSAEKALTLLGPSTSIAVSGMMLMKEVGMLPWAEQEDRAKTGVKAIKFARKILPNLFYTSKIMDEFVFDEMIKSVDKGAYKRMQNGRKRYNKQENLEDIEF